MKYRYSSKQYEQFLIIPLWEEKLSLFQAWNYENILSKLLKNYRYIPSESFNGKTECYCKEIPKPNFINIFDHEWENKKDIILSRFNIKNRIDTSLITKIPARKTIIKLLTSKESKIFLEKNHIQGNINCKVSLGLFFGEELVAVMTFGKPRYNSSFEWELIRFSNKLNTIVMGGASKLFKFFVIHYNPKNIISYSDNKWNKGEIYSTIGMKFSHTTVPNYWYIKGNQIFSRIKCQKSKLGKLFNQKININETESEIMLSNGFQKIYDSGNDVYVYS